MKIIFHDYFEEHGSGYWKVGFALHDVNHAVKYLQTKGIDVSEGNQFLDVGFLTHMKDPQGYSIELLQRTFEENFKSSENTSDLLSQPLEIIPVIGQITLRVFDASRSISFYESLGMKVICIEPVDKCTNKD